MRTKLLFLIGILFVSGQGHSTECPATKDLWKNMLDKLADSITPDIGDEKLYSVGQGPKVLPVGKYQNVVKFWNRCGSLADQDVKDSFSNLLAHSRYMSKALGKGHSGLYLKDTDYLALFKKEASASRLPEGFFDKQYLPADWEKILKECAKTKPSTEYLATCETIKDWLVIPFHSTLQDGAGNFDRIVVYVPGDVYQRFYLFTPKDAFQRQRKIISAIVLQTKDPATGKRLDSLRPVFLDKHERGYSLNQGRCLMCHPNGLREIHPIKGSYVSPQTAAQIRKFNKLVKGYASKVQWGEEVDLKALGPSLGDSCVNCHSKKEGRNPLNVLSYPPMIMSKIHEREMPYGEFYSVYDEIIQRLNKSSNEKLKSKIHRLAVSAKLKSGQFYRTEEQTNIARARVLRALKNEGFISLFEYYKALAVDEILGPIKTRNSAKLFETYKQEFNQWLKNK